MTPEEAYEEALRRIREADETGALELDLSGRKDGKTGARQYSGLETLNDFLRSWPAHLDLSCQNLSGDLSSLANLTSHGARSKYWLSSPGRARQRAHGRSRWDQGLTTAPLGQTSIGLPDKITVT